MTSEHEIGIEPGQRPVLDSKLLEAILSFDTCTIADAIDSFGIRMRNEGFTRPGLNCLTGSNQRILGYAATFRVRSSQPPIVGGKFHKHTDWWSAIGPLPHPTIAVFQSLDVESGNGSCVGNVLAAILKAFGCCGVITNGAIRDISDIKELDIPVYAASLTVARSYMHIVDSGAPVEIFGLSIRQGDLLYADCHGVLAIPVEIAAELPEAAARVQRKEKSVMDICRSADFSPDKLMQAINEKEQCK